MLLFFSVTVKRHSIFSVYTVYMSTISLGLPLCLSAGRPGSVAVHRVHPKGADQVVFVMRRLRKPSLFPGDHLQRPGEPCPILSLHCVPLCPQ